MKKVKAFMGSMFVFLVTYASHNNSEFNIKMFDNSSLEIVLDGNCFSQPGGVLSINNIHPGQHHLKVFKWVKKPYNYYPFKKLVFAGMIKVPASAKMYTLINCYFDYEVLKIVKKKQHGCHHGHNCYCGNPGSGGYGNGGYNGGYNGEDDYDDGFNDNTWDDGDGNYDDISYGMKEADFKNLLEVINGKSFDSSRLEVILQSSEKNKFTSKQVSELMKTLSFETSKMEVAKKLYDVTVDKNNYHEVNKIFSYETSVQELNKHIGKK